MSALFFYYERKEIVAKKSTAFPFAILGAVLGMAMKKKGYLSVAILAFVAGAAFEYWFMTELWPKRDQWYSWKFSARNYREFGEPCDTDQTLDRKGFSLGYSYKYKAALWASYILSSDSVSVDVGRYGTFYADDDIPEQYRLKLKDLTNNGYDKGHLAPSASIDFSEDANRETFALSNVVPQHPKLNRQGWEAVESLERKWTASKGKLFVTTGPVYGANPQEVNGVPIPAKMYKVIYAYDDERAIAFLMPNAPVTDKDIWKYAMSVKELEDEIGLNFFSAMPEGTRNRVKDRLELASWKTK